MLEADYVRIAYIVKFVNGDDEVSVKYIDLGQDAKLSAADIPSAPAAGQGEIFLGWYSGSVKAEVNAAISADTVFEAAFVSEASYDGVWYNDEICLMAVLDYEDGINAVNVMGKPIRSLLTTRLTAHAAIRKERSQTERPISLPPSATYCLLILPNMTMWKRIL